MSPVFKALASISAWVLFISGWVWLLIGGIITPVMAGVLFAGAPPPWTFHAAWIVGGMMLILSACAMKLRQMLV